MTINANSTPPDLNRQILDEASAWFVEFRVGDADVECRAEFDRWLRQSPEHIRAYLEIARAYHSLSELSAEQVSKLSELMSLAPRDQNVVRLEPNAPCDVVTNRTPRSAALARGAAEKRSSASAISDVSGRSRPKIGRWVSASIAASAAAGLLVWITLPKYSTYATGIGESRTITMADGSLITLNALTEMRVRYTKTARVIDLLAGQAFFQVAENKDRPFVVRSGFAVVKDVGTQFDVDRAAKSTTVTVVEGRVALYSADEASSVFSTQPDLEPGVGPDGASVAARAPASASQPKGSSMPPEPRASGGAPGILLAAGEQAVVSAHEISTQTRANIGAATSWLKHRFIFDGSHLSDVVDQFNRYNARQIVIDSPALDDFRISGVYSSTDPDSFLRFLRAQPGIEVTQMDGAFHIAKK